jgi:hypothetical protein
VAGANQILPGYLAPTGRDKIETVFDHAGSSSYANGTGDKINALDLGMGGIEDITGVAIDPTGTYFALYQPTLGGNGNAVPYVYLRWFVVGTAAEVTNATDLHTYTVRLRVRGV